jgi:hypothetical protein
MLMRCVCAAPSFAAAHYNPENRQVLSDNGTSQLTAVDASGMAVTLTTTINLVRIAPPSPFPSAISTARAHIPHVFLSAVLGQPHHDGGRHHSQR